MVSVRGGFKAGKASSFKARVESNRSISPVAEILPEGAKSIARVKLQLLWFMAAAMFRVVKGVLPLLNALTRAS